jgi:3-methyladenine DNA glycosylase AlkD
MAAYMKNHFEFFGVPTPPRRALSRPVVAAGKNLTGSQLIEWADWCWRQPEREFQYVACDLLARWVDNLGPPDLEPIGRLITTKSWWDSVDQLGSHVGGGLVRAHPQLVSVMDRWIGSDNIWLARAAIIHQLRFGADTDKDRLFSYALQRGGDAEFFIRKAIGWSLREYAWREPDAVRSFVTSHSAELSPLTRREALKNIDPKI